MLISSKNVSGLQCLLKDNTYFKGPSPTFLPEVNVAVGISTHYITIGSEAETDDHLCFVIFLQNVVHHQKPRQRKKHFGKTLNIVN